MRPEFMVIFLLVLVQLWSPSEQALPSQKFVTEFHLPDATETNQTALVEAVLTFLQQLSSVQVFHSNVTVTPT